MNVKKAIIPAASLGTRFLPATVDFALKRQDLRDGFMKFLNIKKIK